MWLAPSRRCSKRTSTTARALDRFCKNHFDAATRRLHSGIAQQMSTEVLSGNGFLVDKVFRHGGRWRVAVEGFKTEDRCDVSVTQHQDIQRSEEPRRSRSWLATAVESSRSAREFAAATSSFRCLYHSRTTLPPWQDDHGHEPRLFED